MKYFFSWIIFYKFDFLILNVHVIIMLKNKQKKLFYVCLYEHPHTIHIFRCGPDFSFSEITSQHA